jgi:hypothetical protein
MFDLSDEILGIIIKVLTGEATEEDLQKLKDWCHLQDENGVLFSKLSDPGWIRVNLILMDKIERGKEDIWQHIQDSLPTEDFRKRED